jgi:hypothetical protein
MASLPSAEIIFRRDGTNWPGNGYSIRLVFKGNDSGPPLTEDIMTRHQRRKAAAAKAVAVTRREIVRRNLGTPSVRESTEQLISGVYGNNMDRARGRGVVPMTHKVTRVISASPYKAALGPRASAEGCGWKV